jgi:hypothetical protein
MPPTPRIATLASLRRVAALYVDPKGPYPTMGLDCWDEARDATTYDGEGPGVFHPACGPWSRLRHMCGPELLAQEHLGPIAVGQVRRCGGVLEHPANSRLWDASRGGVGMPLPGEPPDEYGGWTIAVEQWWWGHRAVKPTWLYIVGRRNTPPIPTPSGARPPSGNARFVGDPNRSMLERLPRTQRHITPPAFAWWLVVLAAGCTVDGTSRTR